MIYWKMFNFLLKIAQIKLQLVKKKLFTDQFKPSYLFWKLNLENHSSLLIKAKSSILKDFKIWLKSWISCTKFQEIWVYKKTWTEKPLSFHSKFWKICILWAPTLWKELKVVQMVNLDSLSFLIKLLSNNMLTQS